MELQALWSEPHVTFHGKWHTIDDAGINPLPPRRKIPVWFGGHAEVTMRRWVMVGELMVEVVVFLTSLTA